MAQGVALDASAVATLRVRVQDAERQAASVERKLQNAHLQLRDATPDQRAPEANGTTASNIFQPSPPSTKDFRDALSWGKYAKDPAKIHFLEIAAAILLDLTPSEIVTKHFNCEPCKYVEVAVPRMEDVLQQQCTRRRADVEGLLGVGVTQRQRPAGSERTASAPASARRGARTGACPAAEPIEAQVGFMASADVAATQFNKLLLGFGGSRSPMASIPDLRAARMRLAAAEAKQVSLTSTGAHLASVSLAIQEAVDALAAAGLFVDRLLLGPDGAEYAQTDAYTPQAAADKDLWAASPSVHVKDVHVSIGVDMNGSPGSVKIVAGIINKRRPNWTSNTIVAVCSATKDKHAQLTAVISEHLLQLRQMVCQGTVVAGTWRAVRIFASGNYEALCAIDGLKGPNASMPCLWCYSSRAPSAAQAALDAQFGTLQDLQGVRSLRTAAHLRAMHATPSHGSGGALALAVHQSNEQRPLIAIDPRQVVPVPLHILLEVTIRLLRLVIETVILCKSQAIGRIYADELALELRVAARVEPTPYHGGVFIRRDCHAIAEKSDVVCATLVRLVPKKDSDAYAKSWELWRGVRSTLRRAAVIGREDSVRIRVDTREFLTLLCRSFPWVRVSPKLHALWRHAPDFLGLFGSIGLYGEQGIEAWHGHMNQHADEYPAATELQSASMYPRAMALARDASDSH